MEKTDLNRMIINVVRDPYNPLYNFKLGYEYDKLGQSASAISFYLRAAEFCINNLLSYEALLRCSLCINKHGDRILTVKSILSRAISLLPERPEAYFLLSKVYEDCKEWHESYMIASVGELMIKNDMQELITDIGYIGDYVITFQKAVAAWWIGMFDESIYLFRKLDKKSDINLVYKNAIDDTLNNYGRCYKVPTKYDNSLYDELRYKFNGADKIEKNYSQCYQDMFVLSMTNGKKNGVFVEIGCDDAYFNSNTFLLENDFGWTGISIDKDVDKIEKFKKERKSTVVIGDALKIDFSALLTEDNYDYLQVDCEPAETSYYILKRIPFERVRFAVITFEHDNYCDENKKIKNMSRKYLESFGYMMVVNNISEDRWSDFEDWWVHPGLVKKDIFDRMNCVNDSIKKVDHYMLNKI